MLDKGSGKSRIWTKGWARGRHYHRRDRLSLGAAIPISRTVQEDSSDQGGFIEEAIPQIPATASAVCRGRFPETALIVLATDSGGDIPSQPIKCQEIITT